jgi:hypothetical protein
VVCNSAMYRHQCCSSGTCELESPAGKSWTATSFHSTTLSGAICTVRTPYRVSIRLVLLLQVPWSNLGQQPVVAELDRLFLVAGPKEDDSSRQQAASQPAAAASNPEELERSAKRQRVAAAEAAWLKVRPGSSSGGCRGPIAGSAACSRSLKHMPQVLTLTM